MSCMAIYLAENVFQITRRRDEKIEDIRDSVRQTSIRFKPDHERNGKKDADNEEASLVRGTRVGKSQSTRADAKSQKLSPRSRHNFPFAYLNGVNLVPRVLSNVSLVRVPIPPARITHTESTKRKKKKSSSPCRGTEITWCKEGSTCLHRKLLTGIQDASQEKRAWR